MNIVACARVFHGFGVPLRAASSPSKASTKARDVVNEILGEFPTGRKRFYNSRPRFPMGRKGGSGVIGNGVPFEPLAIIAKAGIRSATGAFPMLSPVDSPSRK